MTYITLPQLKDYLHIEEDTDDVLLTHLIERAQGWIEAYTGRIFEAGADSTRYFDALRDTEGRELYFDADICAITSVTTNADAPGGGTVIPAPDYVTLPRNSAPYYGIRLLGSSAHRWDWTDDPEAGIAVTGRWAYSAAAPADIVQAAARLAGYVYAQKDAQVYDVTASPETGQMVIPRGMPADVKQILDHYRRLA
jgi:uncharacterized phiE125 gp8 family phage protein